MKYGLAGKRAFLEDRTAVLSLLDGHKAGGLRPSSSKAAWQQLINDVNAYFGGLDASLATWRKHFAPVLVGHLTDNNDLLTATFGIEFDVRDLMAERWFDAYELTFAQPIGATSGKELSDLLRFAQQEGMGVGATEKRIEALFDRWLSGKVVDDSELFDWVIDRIPPHRIEMIARTEPMRAANAGSFQTYKQWGAAGKTWLATFDGRTRPDHASANGQTVGIDEPFDVGGVSMMYPHDPAAPASQIVNCRCTIIPTLDTPSKPPVSAQPGVLAPTPDRATPEVAPQPPRGWQLRDNLIKRHEEQSGDELRAWMTKQGDAAYELDQARIAFDRLVNDPAYGLDHPATRKAAKLIDKRADQYTKIVEDRKVWSDNRRNALHETLFTPGMAEIEPKLVGPERDDPRPTKAIKEGFEFLNKMLPTFGERPYDIFGDIVEVNPDFNVRAHYTPPTVGFGFAMDDHNGRITIDVKTDTGTVVHEVGHFLEEHIDGAPERIYEFLSRRTAGEMPVPLKNLTGKNYDDHEVTKPDKFINPYMGKVYDPLIVDTEGGGIRTTPSASEVLSMGLQLLYDDPVGFATKDPDMFDTILDIIRGNDKPGARE